LVATVIMLPIGGTIVFGSLFIRMSSFFRPVLEFVFPSSWISSSPSVGGEPLRVFFVVVLLVVAAMLLNMLARRPILKGLGIVQSQDLRAATMTAFLLNFIFVLTLVAGLGFASFAAGIAEAADLEVDTSVRTPFDRPGAWFMTVLGILFWAAVVTYIFRRKRARYLARRAPVPADGPTPWGA